MAGTLTPLPLLAVARILAGTRRREWRHGARAQSPAVTGLLLAVVVASLGGTFLVSALTAGRGRAALGFVLLLWCGGRVTQSTVTGGSPALAPETLALVPVPRRRLAGALLIVGVTEADLVLLGIVCLSLAVRAWPRGPGAVLAAVIGAGLLTAVTAVASVLARGALAAGSARGRDLGTCISAAAIAVLAGLGTGYPLLAASLAARHPGVVADLVLITPAGWATSAVDGSAATAVGWLLALAALGAGLAAVWPRVLSRRLDGRARPVRRGARAARRRLPGSPTWAVVAKELRLWARDPLRVAFLIIAGAVGVIPAVVAAARGDTRLLPFSALLSVVILCACSVNLYGSELDSIWTVLATPGSAGPDVRGRQLAWLLVAGPYAIVATVVLTALGGPGWAWPWALALLAALLGAGSGIVVAGSLRWVLAPDAGGQPTPAWSAKVHLALYVAALPALVPAALLVPAAVIGSGALAWAAVAVGIATGGLGATALGGRAVRRMCAHGDEILGGGR